MFGHKFYSHIPRLDRTTVHRNINMSRMRKETFFKGPLCPFFIFKKLFTIWYLVGTLISYINELTFAFKDLLALVLIIVNQYFVQKSNYYFVNGLLPLRHITG
jgi:hypothetical protein